MVEFTRQFLDELCAKNDIVSVLSRYITLTKKGRTFWACCPFHREKTASFAVDEFRQFYHCFGCGEHGNVISFVQKIEALDFPKTVAFLAELANMELPTNEDRVFEKDRRKLKDERDRLLALNKEAAKYYHANLYIPECKPALNYLSDRGIDNKWIKRFGLGASSGFSQLVKHLRGLGFTEEEMQRAGLAARKNSESQSGQGELWYYDAFAGRLMFPIIDSLGNVVAFGGRLLENADFAKYKNSPATPVFDKSSTLYAHNLLKKANTDHNIDYVILAEGYIDVIALHMRGFDTAVASMGTSLTFEQSRILKRYSDNVIICYDGDGAGQKAALKAVDILKRAGLNAKVTVFPSGMDPDDFLKKYGAEELKRLISRALPPFDYKLYCLKNKYDLNTTDGKTRFTMAAIELIRLETSAVEQEEYLLKLRDASGYTLESLKKQLIGDGSEDGIKRVLASGKIYSVSEKAARFLLYCLVCRFDILKHQLALLTEGLPCIESVDVAFSLDEFLTDDAYKELYGAFLNPQTTAANIADDDSVSKEALNALSELIVEDFTLIDDNDLILRFEAFIRQLAKEKLKNDIADCSKGYETAEPTDKPKYLKKINELNMKIKRLNEAQ